MIEDFDALVNMAYAEGMDDGIRGDNLNPFDSEDQNEQWKSYEAGYLAGIMADYDTRYGE
jgi:trans-aconitate methyltransferase